MHAEQKEHRLESRATATGLDKKLEELDKVECDNGWDEADVIDSCTGLRMLLKCNMSWTWHNIKRVCVQLANGEGRWCYHDQSTAKNARDFLVYGSLFEDYTDVHYDFGWWRLVYFLLVGLGVGLMQNAPGLQLVTVNTVCIVFVAFHIVWQPYRSKVDNWTEVVTNSFVWMSYFVLLINHFIPDSLNHGGCRRNYCRFC